MRNLCKVRFKKKFLPVKFVLNNKSQKDFREEMTAIF